MKRFVTFLFFGVGAAAVALAQKPPAKVELDVIHTKAGTEITGNITRRVGANLEVRATSAAGASVVQAVPIANVERVDFAGAEKIEAELARTKAANLPSLLQKWRGQSELLDVPDSVAGAYGIRVAQLLLENGGESTATTAGQILDQIVKRDWDLVRRDRARALVIESLRRSGKRPEAERAARDFLAQDVSAESKAEVSYYLGLALADDFREFMKENPRWEFDPYMRPKRDQLYNETLDWLLAPYLRYGAPPAATAKSLLAAANFLGDSGASDEAQAIAQDLVTIFPDQPEVDSAKKILGSK